MDKLSLLIVDDEEHIRLLFKEELEEEGYLVDICANGFEALERLHRSLYNLVVLDIKMPGMDGIQTLSEIKKINKDQHVLLCSAYGEFKQDFSSWVSDAYVVKSADMTELKGTISSVLYGATPVFWSSWVSDAYVAKSTDTRELKSAISNVLEEGYLRRKVEADDRQERFRTQYYRALGSSNPDDIRESYTRLARIDPEQARPILLDAGLRQQKEFLVRERVVELLGEYQMDDELLFQMFAQLTDTSWGVRRSVCRVLGRWAVEQVIAPLEKMTSDCEEPVREAARMALDNVRKVLEEERRYLRKPKAAKHRRKSRDSKRSRS